jgi:4-amino-4-deoxy-L-arabinose transferase-like glycosyltransferase
MDQLSSMPNWMTLLVLLSIAWTLPWKGVALWKSARNKHLAWFIVMLIVNTLAILEIIYIFGFSKRKAAVNPGND